MPSLLKDLQRQMPKFLKCLNELKKASGVTEDAGLISSAVRDTNELASKIPRYARVNTLKMSVDDVHE